MTRNQRWSQRELDIKAKDYCAILRRRVMNYRKQGDIKSTKTDSWDIPRVAVACASKVSPYLCARGRNCSNLIHPHPILLASYPSVKRDPQTPAYPLEPHFAEGHCAEPHAANKLLNKMAKKRFINISDILFGKAFSVKNSLEKPYCATCKQTFPQLR